jgi:hypothetical protein
VQENKCYTSRSVFLIHDSVTEPYWWPFWLDITKLIFSLTNSIKQRPSSVTGSRAAGQNTPWFWNVNIHYRVHKSPLLDFIYWSHVQNFITCYLFFMVRGCSAPAQSPKQEGDPLSAVRDCSSDIASLQLPSTHGDPVVQPEGAPCHSDPLTVALRSWKSLG